MLGILITMGIAILASIFIGLFYHFVNRFGPEEQFNDEVIYSDVPLPEIHTD